MNHGFLKQKRNWKVNSRINSWYNTNNAEIYCFLNTVMLMSRVKNFRIRNIGQMTNL